MISYRRKIFSIQKILCKKKTLKKRKSFWEKRLWIRSNWVENGMRHFSMLFFWAQQNFLYVDCDCRVLKRMFILFYNFTFTLFFSAIPSLFQHAQLFSFWSSCRCWVFKVQMWMELKFILPLCAYTKPQ